MIQTKTIAMVVLTIVAVGATATGIGTATQLAQATPQAIPETNPTTGNPHFAGNGVTGPEPTGNPHQFPTCSGDPHGQVGHVDNGGGGGGGGGGEVECPGAQ